MRANIGICTWAIFRRSCSSAASTFERCLSRLSCQIGWCANSVARCALDGMVSASLDGGYCCEFYCRRAGSMRLPGLTSLVGPRRSSLDKYERNRAMWSAKKTCNFVVSVVLSSPCLAALVVPAGIFTDAKAAPVTLQFQATVGTPRQGVDGYVPPSWNMPLAEGDTISGTFTFEPIDAPSDTFATKSTQHFDFTLAIGSHELRTTQYFVEVENDNFVDEPPIVDEFDGIRAWCGFAGSRTQCNPANVAPGDSIRLAFGISLYGDSSLLDGPDLPGNEGVWQAFNLTELFVTFTDPSISRSYGFLATPSSFQFVPEPTTLWSAFVAAFFCAVCPGWQISRVC
jgi:hypothetical protein